MSSRNGSVFRVGSRLKHSAVTGPRGVKPGCGNLTANIPVTRNEATLYIHWPYCRKKCHYCNFNKYTVENVDHERMEKCLVRETKTLLFMSGVERIRSVFFGGGTPSLAKPSTIAAVINSVRDSVALADDTEISMEANPTSADSFSRLQEFKAAGINRLSLGIQSFRDHFLELLGRDHSPLDSLKALEASKNLFPGRVSVDLIFGIPGQRLADWNRELDQLLQVCDDHISLYQLTLERGTKLFKWNALGEISLPDTDEVADMYQTAVGRLKGAGFHRYEVSNFARGCSASVHNLSYWTGGQYIGVGPGAHGRFAISGSCSKSCDGSREARVQTLEPKAWMREVESFGHATCKSVKLSHMDLLNELVVSGLRTDKGISNGTWMQFSRGSSLLEIFGNCAILKSFCQDGLLEINCESMRVTDKGLDVLDSIIPNILIGLEKWQAG